MRLRHSVVALLGTVFAIPMAGFLAMSGMGLGKAWQGLSASSQAQQLAAVDRSLFMASQETRALNGQISNALQTEAAPAARLAALQQMLERSGGSAIGALAGLDLPEVAAPLDRLRQSAADVTSRMELARSLGERPPAERDLRGLAPLSAAIGALGEALNNAGGVVSTRIRLTDPVLAELVQIRQLGWAARSNYGQQCAVLRPYVASSRPLDAAGQAQFTRLQSGQANAFSELGDILGRAGAPAAPKAALAAATGPVAEASRWIEGVVARLDGSGTPAMPAAEWTARCNAPFAVLNAIGIAALDEADAHAAALRGGAIRAMAIQAALMLFALLLAGAAASVLLRRLARPVAMLRDAMGRLAQGDLATPVPMPRTRDEFRQMAEALEAQRAAAAEAEALREAERRRQAEELARAETVASLCREFEAGVATALRDLDQSGEQLSGTAQRMREHAGKTGEQASAASGSAGTALENVNTVAAATEELGASIREIASRVQNAASEARGMAQQAERTSGAVQALSGAAERIGEVVELIRRIAEQTNLLALNATIEAARAGEAGKGFAVVASEVKNLATETARATDGIAQLVSEIREATGGTVTAMQAITHGIADIDASTAAIAAAVEEQSVATQEIARSVQLAAAGTEAVAGTIASVASDSEATGASAEVVFGAVQDVAAVGKGLRGRVENFLAAVRAA